MNVVFDAILKQWNYAAVLEK